MQCGGFGIHCEGGEKKSTCPAEGEETITLMYVWVCVGGKVMGVVQGYGIMV